MKQTLILITISIAVMFISCSKSSDIGGDIVGVDDYETKVSTDINLKARTVTTTPVRAFSKGQNPNNHHFLGRLIDPVFGESRAEIDAQFLLTGKTFSSKFQQPEVDSVVLVLEYDSLNIRGKIKDTRMDVHVYRLEEQLSNQANYSANVRVNYNPTPIGELINSPTYIKDSLVVKTPNNGKIIEEKLSPHLRINLENSLGEELLTYDSMYYAANPRFLEKFKGLRIEADVENTLLAFKLLSSNSKTALNIYYKEDTVPKLFQLYVTSGVAVAKNTFEHNYDNSIVNDHINNSSSQDSLLFIQGMSGVELELEIEDLSQFEDKVINLAELTMYYADIGNEESVMRDLAELTIIQSLDERDVLISDAENAELSSNPSVSRELFGGKAIEVDSTTKLTQFKIPVYFQEIVRGKYKPVVRIRPRTKAITADRGIFYGPDHPKYPMKLKVIYTDIE